MADAILNMNMLQVRENLQSNTKLNDTQSRDLVSAVNTFAKWLELPLDKIPADRRSLRKGFDGLNASQLGVSKKRFANVRSGVDQALDHGMMGNYNETIQVVAPAWQTLLELVPEGWQRFKVAQLARYATNKKIDPSDVTAETFTTWTTWREENASLSAKPERIVKDVWMLWNRCAREVSGWPQAEIPRPSKKSAVLLPLDQFSDSFQEELKAFEKASTTVDAQAVAASKSYRSAATPEKKSTVTPRVAKNRVSAIRMCATSLIEAGEAEPEDLTSIKEVVSADAAGLMAESAVARVGRVTEYPLSLVKDLRAVAVQWLNIDETEIAAFNGIMGAIAKDADMGGLTYTNRQRLAPFRNPQNISRLVSLPDQMFDVLETQRKKTGRVTIHMACRARTAIGIATLTMLPIRRANLAAIEIGKQLVLPAARSDQAYLTFEPHEVKNTRSIGCAVPDAKRALLDLYLHHYRPVIVGKDPAASPFLLSTQTGKAIDGNSLNHDVRELIRAETGLIVNLHLFRHLMAALILRERPGAMDTVRALLGHSKDSRVTALYAEIETEIAAGVLEDAIAAEGKRRPKRRPAVRKWKR